MSTTTLNPDVARGIAWLDEEVPGWRDRINLGTLNVGELRNCVLGQVFGAEAEAEGASDGFMYVASGAWERRHYPERTSAEVVTGSGSWARTHGFDISFADYEELTAEWREVLAAS